MQNKVSITKSYESYSTLHLYQKHEIYIKKNDSILIQFISIMIF